MSDLRPLSIGETERLMQDRFALGAPLQIVGGRTSLPPAPPDTVPLVTSGMTRIVDYPAGDMTITVEAGLRVEELQKALREQGQTLPIDIPQAHRATIGGAIASNASGPGRFGHGTFRDYVIGVRAVDGRGRLFAAGGRVVKNVAGYDLCKLLVGSRGELAVIVEVTLKLRPLPETRRLIWAQLPGWNAADAVLEQLVRSATRPSAVEVLNARAAQPLTAEARLDLPVGGVILCVGYDGSARETDWQAETLHKELAASSATSIELLDADDARSLWTALTEYQTASDEPATVQAALRPSHALQLASYADELGFALQIHAGNGVVIGHWPDATTEIRDAARVLADLRRRLPAGDGTISLLRCEPEWRPALHEASAIAPSPIARRLKGVFDPRGLFQPDGFATGA